jgi:hypothetical protein
MEKKAEYQISSSVHDGILEIIFTGELIISSHDKIVTDVGAIIRENSVDKVLIDISDLEGRLGIVDSYSRVRNFPPHVYKISFAVVNVNGLSETEMFQENTGINAGIKVKFFTDIDEARDWLKSK